MLVRATAGTIALDGKTIDFRDDALRRHTRGLGIANALAAFEEGAARADGTVGGLGGCPFAPGTWFTRLFCIVSAPRIWSFAPHSVKNGRSNFPSRGLRAPRR